MLPVMHGLYLGASGLLRILYVRIDGLFTFDILGLRASVEKGRPALIKRARTVNGDVISHWTGQLLEWD